jgi:hypothetical protein
VLFCANFVSCWFSSLSASTRWSNYNFPISGSPAKCRLNCRRASRFHAGIYSYLYRCYFWKKERYFFCPPVQTHCSRGLFGIPTPCFLLVEKYVCPRMFVLYGVTFRPFHGKMIFNFYLCVCRSNCCSYFSQKFSVSYYSLRSLAVDFRWYYTPHAIAR